MKITMSQRIRRTHFQIQGMKVSNNGEVIRWYGKELKKSFPPNPASLLKPQKDKKGNAIIRTRDHGDLRIDRLVENCFHGRPGIHDHIIHIYGNPFNCRLNNLERVTIKEYNRRYHPDDEWKELFSEEDEVEINVITKEVRQHGKLLPIQEEIQDTDND